MKQLILFKILKYTAWLFIPIFMKVNKYYVRKVYGSTKGYDRSSAISLDMWANKEFRTGLNYLMLTPKSKHHFGSSLETMSSVFGKNKKDNTLSETGIKWSERLDGVDPNHCLDSINNKVNYKDKDFDFIISKNKKYQL